MTTQPAVAHQAGFEKLMRSCFPFMSLHLCMVPPKNGLDQWRWQYGVEWVQAMYETYCQGRNDEAMERMRKHLIYQVDNKTTSR